jgi:hypothetical protein
MESDDRRLMWHGLFLFLLGLVTGLLEQRFTNIRMGLSAHLEGVMNGTFSGCSRRNLERGQTAAAGKGYCVLGHPLRRLWELAVHHACCGVRYGGLDSNRSCRSSWETLARESGRGRLPERRDCDHRVRAARSMGSSGQRRGA